MEDDFKRGNCDKFSKVGLGWYFNNGDTITIVGIEGEDHIVELKNKETTITQKFTFDGLVFLVNAYKGLVAITDNNWETCMTALSMDNGGE